MVPNYGYGFKGDFPAASYGPIALSEMLQKQQQQQEVDNSINKWRSVIYAANMLGAMLMGKRHPGMANVAMEFGKDLRGLQEMDAQNLINEQAGLSAQGQSGASGTPPHHGAVSAGKPKAPATAPAATTGVPKTGELDKPVKAPNPFDEGW